MTCMPKLDLCHEEGKRVGYFQTIVDGKYIQEPAEIAYTYLCEKHYREAQKALFVATGLLMNMAYADFLAPVPKEVHESRMKELREGK